MLTFVVLKVPVRAQSSHLHYKKEVEKSRSSRLGFLVFYTCIGYEGSAIHCLNITVGLSGVRPTGAKPLHHRVARYRKKFSITRFPSPEFFRKALSSFRPQANYLSHNILWNEGQETHLSVSFIVETHKKFCAKRFFSLSRTIFKSQANDFPISGERNET